jgi:large subunit ribosomal protein L31
MKKDIHPDYHEITVQTVNGATYKTQSTWGKPGDVMKLDIDPETHPAWTGGPQRIMEGGRMAKFSGRFGSFGGAKNAAKSEKKEETSETTE